MKKIILIIILILIFVSTIMSQNQANNWYLGHNCIISFDTKDKKPQNIKVNFNPCTVHDVTASISDKAGNFLFLTDPTNYVCNKFHQRINKKFFLGSYTPSNWAQRAIFIPKPGSDSLVYLFVSSGDILNFGLRYFLLDTKANNDSADFIKYFVYMGQSFSTKIAATYHENGNDIWIVTHEWDSNTFRSYLITDSHEDDINTFVASSTGPIFSGNISPANGFMKISPNGKKLAYHFSPKFNDRYLALFDFNNRTGRVSNPIIIPHQKYNRPYYLEFSPNGSKLYSIENYTNKLGNNYKYIVQYNTNSKDSLSLIKSKKIVALADTLTIFGGSLQLAPDGKIYFPLDTWNPENNINEAYYLGTINYPNAEGRNCITVDSSFKMLYSLSAPLIQNFISTYFWDSCDVASFSYPLFKYTDGLVTNGSAKKIGNMIRLTDNKRFQRGSIWYENKVPVTSSFELTFSFRLSGATNENSEDGSEPGADGISLVIKNSDDILGTTGGGIAYDGIRNSIAIEIDLYNNKNNNDISGNHISVQASKGRISSKHTPEYTMAIRDIPLIIKSDSTIYYCKILHNSSERTLSIYLDTNTSFIEPILVLDSFDISKVIDLDNDKYATIGLTSATGDARQRHNIIYWYFCSKEYLNHIITNVNNDFTTNIYDNISISPNPATDFVEITTDARTIADAVEIYDVLGVCVLSHSLALVADGGKYRVDVSGLAEGIYFLHFGGKLYKFVKM